MQQDIMRKDVGGLRRIMRTDEFSVMIPLLAILLITTTIRSDFLTVNNFSAMFTVIPYVAIVGLGASFPLMAGFTDISTGKVAGFAGIIMSTLVYDLGWTAIPAILAGLLCAIVIGLLNGLMVVRFGVPDFVATLGTFFVVGGARYLFIKGYVFALKRVDHFEPVVAFFQSRILGMPPTFWIMLIFFTIGFVINKRTVLGRRIMAVGDNREVATLVGINVDRLRMIAYLISATMAGIAGILFTLDFGLGLPETGDDWAFRAIAGCVVGGVSLSGGKGSPLGILIGVTLIFVAENAIIFVGLPANMRIAVQGILMALAVLFDIYRQKRKVPA